MSEALIESFYHEPTGSWSYVVSDPSSREAAVIDAVLDFSIVSGRTGTEHADRISDYVEREGLTARWLLETHAHADHLSAAATLGQRLGGQTGIGAGIREVQSHFADVYNLDGDFVPDGSQFDRLFDDGDTFAIGELECRVMHTPGHTNDSVAYLVGDAAFVGDTLFMPDVGTARCDFPGGDAGLLYDSIRRLYALPGATRLFVGHDYPAGRREARAEVSVVEQKSGNVHLDGHTSRDDYIALRETRDRSLSLPALMLPALQVNIRAGGMPPVEDNGVAYLKIPLDQF